MKKHRISRKLRRASQLAERKRLKQLGRRAPLPDDRRGSIIVVVIALLSALMFLGFVFFSLSSQENENAEYFKEASKVYEPLDFDPNDIFDCFLEQLILGAPDHKYNSIFWGGKISLLPTMYGTDASPFNGEGVNTIWYDPGGGPDQGYPLVNRDYDPQPDGIAAAPAQFAHLQRPLAICLAPGALLDPNTGAPYAAGTPVSQFDLLRDDGVAPFDDMGLPEPDVNYLAPDHNFPMLTYFGYTYNTATNNFELVVIPAGERDQLLRNRVGPAAGAWYTSPETLPFVLRPHQQRRAVNDDGVITAIPRYWWADFTSDPQQDIDPNTEAGVWSQHITPGAGINYDVDPTGRGVFNSVYLDCDFPIQTDPNTGDQFVPLVGAFIIDGESLLNLNVVGNNSEYLVRGGGTTIFNIPANASLSRSNLGMSRSEINPLWALLTDPSTATPAEQQPYIDFYNATWPVTSTQMANMELLSLLQGRAEITGGVATQAYPGRWGEPDMVISNWNGSKLVTNFPRPGVSGADDNGNANEGGIPLYAVNLVNPHPYDPFGVGTIVGTDGYHRFLPVSPLQGLMRFPGYANYTFVNNGTTNFFPYQTFFSGTLTPGADLAQPVRDEPDEMVADTRFASLIPGDSPFSPGAAMSLQLTRTDLNQLGYSSPLDNLAPFTFTQATDEEEIRSRFTTISYQMKTHGASFPSVNRPWEWNAFDATDFSPPVPPSPVLQFVFPPTSGVAGLQNPRPWRRELFELLMSVAGDNRIKTLQRRRSVNSALDRVRLTNGSPQNGYLRHRSLTDHYINKSNPYDPALDLPPGPLPVPPSGDPFDTDAYGNPPSLSPGYQEYFARMDRQRLCRDIYTLLYVFGHPNDAQDTLASNAGFAFYTAQQCRDMAQFAVNLVDQMDTDNVITMFEYDIDLSDGWTPSDYPYSSINHATKNYVYGTEEQTLCLSEGLAVYAPAVENSNDNTKSIDHDGTEWNDEYDHRFLFIELENVSPHNVDLSGNNWEIVVRPLRWGGGPNAYDPDMAGTSAGAERRLVLNTTTKGPVGVGSQARFSIGTFGLSDPAASGVTPPGPIDVADYQLPESSFPNSGQANGSGFGPARLRLAPNFDPMAPDYSTATTIIPAIDTHVNPASYLDLLRDDGQYSVLESTGNANDERDLALSDSTTLSGGGTVPAGAFLLNLDTSNLDFTNNEYRVEVILRRRSNPYRAVVDPTNEVQAKENPWVIVDRMNIPLRRYNELTNQNTVVGDASALVSRGRYQPMYGSAWNHDETDAHDPATYRANSIRDVNEDAPATRYSLWHPHYNHPYTSLAELMNVPLFGPSRLQAAGTAVPNDWTELPFMIGDDAAASVSDARLTGRKTLSDGTMIPVTFGVKALNPAGGSYAPTLGANNRWHRLLDFIEVPSRMNRSLEPVASRELIGRVNGPQTVSYRDAGPLNLNTMSSSLNMAALLDDSSVITPPTGPTTGGPFSLLDQASSPAAPNPTPGNGFGLGGPGQVYDWWEVVMSARDGGPAGDDPVHPGLNLPLPGVPGISVPFRPLSTSANAAGSIQNTILRTNPIDVVYQPGNVQKRDLLELGSFAQVQSPGYDQDYAFKHRLLGKVMNHTTTQSNTFIIFLQADYFRATEEPDGFGGTVVQLHEKMATSPGYRGFFVVDRSLAHDMITQEDIPDRNNPNKKTFSFNPNFNWRALVVHRQRLN